EHFNGEFVGLKCDVRDSEQVKSVVNTMVDRFGGIDVLIPNAGLGHFNRLDESPLEEWKSMVCKSFLFIGMVAVVNCLTKNEGY
ncbi:MAG: SDR family NAD(P)-dependent oxidoreductase, partial [Flammeovirgaceae bacterium]